MSHSIDIQRTDRVAIFGGTFNPIHQGHLKAAQMVQQRLGLDRIVFVPAAQNPMKPEVDGASDIDRLEMVRRAVKSLGDGYSVDTGELNRGGLSYTIDTLKAYAAKVEEGRLYLLIGSDQLEQFDRWKSYREILNLANLVVVTRPGYQIPVAAGDLPPGLRDLVEEFDRSFCTLQSGRTIEFVRLMDNEVSASDIRKRIRTGRSVDRFLTMEVEEYIKTKGLYAPLGPRIGDFAQFTSFCAQVLFDKKGIDVRGYDLTALSAPSEFALLASGTSTRHAAALSENLVRAVKEEFNVLPQSLEGQGEGRWVVVDYGSLIVHLFYDFVRHEYRLEQLWKGAVDLGLKDQAPAPASAKAH
jgi:nicotinate-nucleotide adenylyltransferase